MRYMSRLGLAALACLQVHAGEAAPSRPATHHAVDAHAVLEAALSAMGGRDRLAGLHALALDLHTVSYRIDDSERADGPYWLSIGTGTEWRDLDRDRYRRDMQTASAQWPLRVVTIDTGSAIAQGSPWRGAWYWSARKPALQDALALSPERMLLTAAAATDLRRLPDATLHAQPQQVLGFSWQGHAARLYLDTTMHLPSRLEVDDDLAGSRNSVMLGDAGWRTDYLFYKRQPDGLVYPFQWNLSRDGTPIQTTVVTALRENAAAPAEGFDAPASAKLDLAAIARAGAYGSGPLAPVGKDPLLPVATDAWLIAGAWNVMVVRQADGLVVIEAPESSARSDAVLDLLAGRFPSQPVKAVVSTTDSLWHYAGLRSYIARGIPVYALDANLALLRRAASHPHGLDPDALSRAPRAPRFVPVAGPTRIGSGAARIDLYPIRGHGDERMLMAYLPGARLLYGSSNDIGQGEPLRATFNAFELVARVDALGLPVRDYVAIHTAKMPWREFRDIVLTRPPLSSR